MTDRSTLMSERIYLHKLQAVIVFVNRTEFHWVYNFIGCQMPDFRPLNYHEGELMLHKYFDHLLSICLCRLGSSVKGLIDFFAEARESGISFTQIKNASAPGHNPG